MNNMKKAYFMRVVQIGYQEFLSTLPHIFSVLYAKCQRCQMIPWHKQDSKSYIERYSKWFFYADVHFKTRTFSRIFLLQSGKLAYCEKGDSIHCFSFAHKGRESNECEKRQSYLCWMMGLHYTSTTKPRIVISGSLFVQRHGRII